MTDPNKITMKFGVPVPLSAEKCVEALLELLPDLNVFRSLGGDVLVSATGTERKCFFLLDEVSPEELLEGIPDCFMDKIAHIAQRRMATTTKEAA